MGKGKSVIIQLQEEALDKEMPLSDLLRKAFVVARKLGLSDFQTWVEKELNGYDEGADIPAYREAYGQVRGWNPYHGWQPVFFEDPKMGEALSRRYNAQSVAELESLIEGATEETSFAMPFSHEVQQKLSKGFGFTTEVVLFTPRTVIIKILDAVRNIILNWALKLEEDDIFGEGLAFTPKEKKTAASGDYNITNFYGPVINPQLQQGGDTPIQVQVNLDIDKIDYILREFKEALPTLNLSPEVDAEVKAELQTIEAQRTSPKPKHSTIRESLNSIRRILEGAGGGTAAHLLIELGKIIF